MSKNFRKHSYEPTGWQNFHRRLTREEYEEIGRRISGLHFAKEALSNDPIALQGLLAAEALRREVEILIQDNPFPETTD